MYITPNAHYFRSLSQLHANWIYHLKPWLDANGPKIAESFQSSPVYKMPYIDVFLQQTLVFLVFLSRPVVSYCTIIRKLAFRKKILLTSANWLATSKFESGAQADLMGYMQILQTQAWNCHMAAVILRYAWSPLSVLPLLFSLNGGSMFARLVWLKRNGNSICWVPPWRIITSAISQQ